MDKVFTNLIGCLKARVNRCGDNQLACLARTSDLSTMYEICEGSRDLKNLLGLDKIMHKEHHLMEKMRAMVLPMPLAKSLGRPSVSRCSLHPDKHNLYSDLFVLPKLK
jgi:hypothetical protein